MRYIVLIYYDSDKCQFASRSDDQVDHDSLPPRSLAPARAVASALPPSACVSARPTWPAWVSRLEISYLCSLARRPLARLLATPILGVPTVYGGYSTMLNFWHGMGVSPSLWLQILAVVAGITSGLVAIARLRT